MLKKSKILKYLDSGKSDSYRSLQAILPSPTTYIEIRISRKMLIAIFASFLVHALFLFLFTRETKQLETRPLNHVDDTLNVELNPLPQAKSTPQAASPPKQPTPTPPLPHEARVSRPIHHHPVKRTVTTARPILSAIKPAPSAPVVPELTPVPAPPETPNTPAPTDMSSYINMVRARKRAESGESTAAQPSGDDARMANIKRNLQPQGGGGVFQIIRVGTESAEFTFRGWDSSTYSSPMRQTIYVQADGNTDIEHAIVRKMIAIIRERHPGDFTWESYRLGRSVTLSARVQDNAGLEDFMLKEFFYNSRRPSEQ
ncbi:MAG: hypothetical protein ACYCSS_03100 [Sulfuriferula sp.]